MRHLSYGCLSITIALAVAVSALIEPRFACGLFSALLAATCLVSIHRWRTNRPYTVAWRCGRCGYGLFGASQPTCPECGHPISEEQIRNAPPGIYRFGGDEKSRD